MTHVHCTTSPYFFISIKFDEYEPTLRRALLPNEENLLISKLKLNCQDKIFKYIFFILLHILSNKFIFKWGTRDFSHVILSQLRQSRVLTVQNMKRSSNLISFLQIEMKRPEARTFYPVLTFAKELAAN